MTELDAMQAVATALAVITVANGYSCNAGQRVYQFRDGFSPPDRTPYLAVLFTGRETENGSTRLVGCPQIRVNAECMVVGAIESDADGGPGAPWSLIDDIDRALLNTAATATFSAAGITLTPTTALPLPHEDGDATVEVQSSFNVQFTKVIA